LPQREIDYTDFYSNSYRKNALRVKYDYFITSYNNIEWDKNQIHIRCVTSGDRNNIGLPEPTILFATMEVCQN